MPDLTFDAVLLCEDIRFEDNGQPMLLGVFGSGHLAYKSFPSTKRNFAAYVLATSTKSELEIEYRLVKHGSSSPLKSGGLGLKYTGEGELREAKLDFPLDLSETEFESPGKYNLQLRQKSDRWKTVTDIEVKLTVGE